MAGFTEFFNLAYFDFGDYLNEPFNVEREIDRFLLIDKQIYGLYTIFGNGVVNGWNAYNNGFSNNTGISIVISSGNGVIQSRAAFTYTPFLLPDLTPNSVLYIYAQHNSIEFTSTNDVSFIFSTASTMASAVKIARVETTSNGISTIDNTDRDYLIVDTQINNAIFAHKHRGQPTKINLETETKNRLSGAKIESVDATQLSSGRFGLERAPALNHNDLIYRGVLTHAQLDTYIGAFSGTNLLSEVSTANRMKQTLYLKERYSNVDARFVNEINYIAGVSPTSYCDLLNTTAIVDTVAHTIAGFPFASTTAYFFTRAFSLPASVTRCFITSNQEVLSDGQIIFGINMNNSVDFGNYDILTRNTVNTVDSSGQDMRIGIRIVSPSNLYIHDPYATLFVDYVDFEFFNDSTSTANFHFRIRFYTDAAMTNLYTTFYSLDDQENWIINDRIPIPSGGVEVDPGESANITLYPPNEDFTAGLVYYLDVDIWDGTAFSDGGSGWIFMINDPTSEEKYENIPHIDGFSIIFELDNNQKVMLNL